MRAPKLSIIIATLLLAIAGCNAGGGLISIDTTGSDLPSGADAGADVAAPDAAADDVLVGDDTVETDLLVGEDTVEPDLLVGEDTTPDVCVPDCELEDGSAKECGDDGCGGDCGTCPGAAPLCEDGICMVECIPICEFEDGAAMECGDDGCDGSCGECPGAAPFCVEHLCVVDCTPECAMEDGSLKECGDDGCGGSCGTCDDGWECVEDLCVEICIPICEFEDGAIKECGDDGCDGSCGECADDLFCVDGLCEEECVSDEDCTEADLVLCTEDLTAVLTCEEIEAGCFQWSDPEDCEAKHHCEDGECVPDCVPDCNDIECGDDGCGGSCGSCGDLSECLGGDCECLFEACADLCCPAGDVCEGDVCCTPMCDGVDCGSDGCGGSCGECIGAQDECQEGACVCVADCKEKACGDDGCGADCGLCDPQHVCQEGACVCVPACEGKDCGPDGCGGDCGTCTDCDAQPADVLCGEDGVCIVPCCPSCEGKACGADDGCAGICDGFCDDGYKCENFERVPICIPDCGGKDCGGDGCGGSCGTCFGPTFCSDAGVCQNICDLECVGKDCGGDGCGGFCGFCDPGLICTDGGLCVEDCVIDCSGKFCGHDGCGGSCGECDAGEFCDDKGECNPECTPDCAYMDCGSDGCGGSCGECAEGLICTVAGTCGGECTLCTYAPECADLDFEEGTLGSWEIDAAQIIPVFWDEAAPTGGYMLKLTTGEGITVADSHAVFQTCIPPDDYAAIVTRKVYSAEFVEYCGSSYQDTFHAWVEIGDQIFQISDTTIDDLCPPDACNACGAQYAGLEESDVILDQGGVWETPWHVVAGLVTVTEAEQIIDLHVEAADAGDTIYDAVLLVDRVQFIPCDDYCAEVGATCGPHPCGGTCGECTLEEVCVAGQCVCVPDCAGMECGDDGCGGSCGVCEGVQQECQAGACVCVPDCKNKECGNDGCGGICGICNDDLPCTTDACQSDGTCIYIESGCCATDDDCADDDPCTDDACVNTLCVSTPSDDPACCEPDHFIEDFDDGQAQGWSATPPVNGVGWTVWEEPLVGDSPALYYGNPETGDYNAGTTTEGAIISPEVDLAADQAWTLSFDVYLDTEAGTYYDALTFWASWDGGPWVLLWDKGDYADQQTWQEVALDLSALAGTTAQFMFSFDSGDAVSNSTLGVLVDDFALTTTCTAATCTDSDGCSVDLPGTLATCEDGLCVWEMPMFCVSDTQCNDDDVCTDDECVGGVCVYDPWENCCHDDGECDDEDLCTTDTCIPGYLHPVCSYEDIEGCCNEDADCFDGNPCTTDVCPLPGEQCINEDIEGCCLLSTKCDDDDPCTLDLCVANVCTHTDQCCDADADCDDGDPCTADACADGVCANTWVGGEGCCVPPIFRDDFSGDLGWTYDEPWERGPAVAGSGSYYNDPGVDHSSSEDNYLAGASIGGTIPQQLVDWTWITSPAFDTSQAGAPMLSYWRWLTSDYTPYMANGLEVWDGAAWFSLWESGYPGINETAWSFHEYDLTLYKGPETRIRFGYMIGSGGVYSVGGWSLDDVQVRDASLGDPTCCDQTSDCQGIFDPAVCLDGNCL